MRAKWIILFQAGATWRPTPLTWFLPQPSGAQLLMGGGPAQRSSIVRNNAATFTSQSNKGAHLPIQTRTKWPRIRPNNCSSSCCKRTPTAPFARLAAVYFSKPSLWFHVLQNSRWLFHTVIRNESNMIIWDRVLLYILNWPWVWGSPTWISCWDYSPCITMPLLLFCFYEKEKKLSVNMYLCWQYGGSCLWSQYSGSLGR